MGYRAKTNGIIGFVTAGHVGNVGDVIKGKSSTASVAGYLALVTRFIMSNYE